MEVMAEVEVAAEISVEAAEAAAAAAVASVKVQAVPWAAVVAAEVPLTGPWTDFRPSRASPLSTSPL